MTTPHLKSRPVVLKFGSALRRGLWAIRCPDLSSQAARNLRYLCYVFTKLKNNNGLA